MVQFHFYLDRDQWLVQCMLEYFFKTGSQRILEVMVKAQAPHDGHIFDKLDDCLKQAPHRVQSLQVFCFIVRHHPTWLYKIEKHRLIKSVFKLLMVSYIESLTGWPSSTAFAFTSSTRRR